VPEICRGRKQTAFPASTGVPAAPLLTLQSLPVSLRLLGAF